MHAALGAWEVWRALTAGSHGDAAATDVRYGGGGYKQHRGGGARVAVVEP